MKRIVPFLLVMMLIALPAAAADPQIDGQPPPQRFTVGVEGWYVQGDQVLTGGPVYAANRFELTHPVDGIMGSVYGELRMAERWMIRGAFGVSQWDKGTMTDTDWDDQGNLWYLSDSTSSGDSLTFEADLFFRVLRAPNGSFLDLAAGYRSIENTAKFKDGLILVDDYQTYNLQTYGTWNNNTLELRGFRLGVRGEAVLGQTFALNGSLGYIPYLWGEYRATRYPGTGVEQYESADPKGQGFEAAAAFEWRPLHWMGFQFGYRYLKWEADGDENPGSSFYGINNEFELTMSGPFITALFRF